MAERSQFWNTTGVGDGIALSANQFGEWLRATFTNDKYVTEGVLGGHGNSLAVTGTATPVSVNTGVAYVNGIYYQNTTSATVAVSTPSTGTTGHRLVLRATTASQTVRMALKSSNDGTSSAPAVQQDSAVWEISLATLSVTTSGVITVTDARDYCHPSPAYAYRRLGNSSSDWSTAGGTLYRPGATRIQTGVSTLSFNDDDDSSTKTITFPVSFSGKPVIYLTTLNNAVSGANRVLPTVYSQGSNSFGVRGRHVNDGSYDTTVTFAWVAIGPK